MATTDQMLRAIHLADPSTLNARYSAAQLLSAYNKLVVAPAAAKAAATTTTTPVSPAQTSTSSSTVSTPVVTTPAQTTGTTQMDNIVQASGSTPSTTEDEMLRFIHAKDPSTLNNRYSLDQLTALYNNMKAPAATTTTTPVQTGTTDTATTTPVVEEAKPVNVTQPTGFTTDGMDATALAKEKAQIEAEIARRGGAANAPNFVKQLEMVNAAITKINTPPSGGSSPPPGGDTTPSGGDNPTPSGDTTTSGGSNSVAITADDIARFQQTVAMGKQFGQGLISDLGLNGQFLGRVAEGPSDSYYQDLARLRDLTANAGNLTTLDNEALGYARDALPGLDARENSALRSAAVQDVDRQFGQARQQLLRYQGGMGSAMQRSAQMADLSGKRVDAQRSLARDLLIQNIQEKKQARDAFANLTGQVQSRADTRTQNLSSLLQAGGLSADTMKQSGQQFNTGLQSAEVSARTAALTGGIGAVGSAIGGYKAEDFQSQALREALAAKDSEIAAAKAISDATLASQEKIAKMLKGQV